MIEQYIVGKALDAALDVAKKVLRRSKTKLSVTREDLEQSIEVHLKAVNKWSGEISFTDIKNAKRTTDIYIELDLFVYPRYIRYRAEQQIESIPLLSIFDNSNDHFVLLGHPGAGKTTSMRYVCQQLFYNENFHADRFSFPILIRLRDLNDTNRSNDSSIISTIFRILGLKIELPDHLKEPEARADRKALREKLVVSVLEELNILLILDGFDELAKAKKRTEVVNEIRFLVEHLHQSTLIVTSRTGDFKYRIEGMIPYEISPLTKGQISTFALKWLNNEEAASTFLDEVSSSPFADAAIRPLTLAHLCAIYEREGKIPDRPKTIYRKIIRLLVEEWDQQRSVKRESSYAHFEVDRKLEFLSQLAYELTTSIQRTVFTSQNLTEVYTSIHEDYGLDIGEAPQVVSELESHTGLFIQSGYEQFEFAHKSLQEFLTAEYLVKLPSIPASIETLTKLPYELAIATTISSRPSDYFSELVFNRLRKHKLSEEFTRAFVSRLVLEKPDFNSSTMLGLALIVLYTVYVESNVVRSQTQEQLFYFDPVRHEFERLMGVVLRKSSIEVIQYNYRIERSYTTDDEDQLLRMMRVQSPEYYGAPNCPNEMPKIIYIKKSLLGEPPKYEVLDDDEIPF